jgi:adenylate cyclase
VRYLFGDCALDTDRRELVRGSDVVPVEPQVFDLLVHLIRNRDRLVSKDDLLASVWHGRIVSESNLNMRIHAVRCAIGDSGEDQRLVKTWPRKGIRFVGSVQEEPGSPDVDYPSLSLPSRPSIAVLPFTNMSCNTEEDYFADGIVEDITTELARFGELFVIARNTSFQYKGRSCDVRQVGRDLGVRYVLEGGIRRTADRVRVSAQLIDAENGGHLWAEKYDCDLADILEMQDAVTRSVVAAIQPQILVGEGRRAARKTPSNLNAFDCYMRGVWYAHQRTPEDNRHAETWLRRSMDLDPKLPQAHMMLARILAGRCWVGDSDDIEHDLEAARIAAEKALMLDDYDAASHYAFSIISLLFRRHEAALASAQRAIALNPNFALGYFALGETRIFNGDFVDALDPLACCVRLSPRDPFSFFFISLSALAHYHIGNYREALEYSERALQRRRAYVVLRTAAATLGQLGRTEEASLALIEMGRTKPRCVARHWELTSPYANPAHEAHLLEGLHKAGLPKNGHAQ